MQYNMVLFGDESGLPVLGNVVKSYKNIIVKLIIVSQKRGPKAFSVGNTMAEIFNCPLLVQPSSDCESYHKFVDDIKSVHPNIGIVFSYDRVLKRDILDLFQGQIYNVHGSLLPKYRGANVLNWVLINDEKKTGVTIHVMVPEVDAGPIVAQKEIEIDNCDTSITLQKKIIAVTDELLHHFLCTLLEGTLELFEQDKSEVTVVRRRRPEDGYFSWNQDAKYIYNLIRALVAPWPGAWYVKDGQKYVIDYFISYDQVLEMKRQLQDEEEYEYMCNSST